MDGRTRKIVDLFCATSDGTPAELQRLIDRGYPWDKPLPRSAQLRAGATSPSPTIPINLAAQYLRADNLAVLATKALSIGRPELLESCDLKGRSPAYLAIQKGSPECLGVMAKAGANLHRATPHVYQIHGNDNLIDSGECFPIHHALNQTTLSFTTRTCLKCYKGNECEGITLKVCNQCKLAYFCSPACQQAKWPEHKKVCKKIRKGSDLVTINETMPRQALVDEGGFLPFDEQIDNDLELEEGEREEDYYDATKQWEYFDLSSRTWKPYPKVINRGIEGMHEMDMSPRYMYKPQDPDAEGMEQYEITPNPPSTVSTNHVYYEHMIDHHVYTGAGRRIRRRVIG